MMPPSSVPQLRIHAFHKRGESWAGWIFVLLIGISSLLLVGMIQHILQLDSPSPPVSVQTESTDADAQERQRPAIPSEPVHHGLPSGLLADFDWDGADDRASLAAVFETEPTETNHSRIDEFIFDQLARLEIEPANRCSDATFFRRVHLDTIGTLPTASETRRFLDDPDEDKRHVLIESLLDRAEFADYWAMKWSDVLRVKAEFPINLWPHAAQAYHRWIRTSIQNNRPYDEFAYELLTSSGSNFRTPQVNFFRALQSNDPESIANAVALTFLCERSENWPQRRLHGMSEFFSKVGYKPTGEWKEEIVFFDPRRDTDIATNEPVKAVFPNGVSIEIPPDQDPREVFAKWLIDDQNPWFARAIANRIWFWLHGRGIVDPPDDVRGDNPASNLALLDYLADELVAADYNLKHLFRIILQSNTYQLSCIAKSDSPLARENFAFYQPRRHDAEVLIDAICQITGTTETYMSIIPEPFTFLPNHQRAIALPDGSITSSFLELFGRPPRDSGLASERDNRLTSRQSLHLLNSNHIRNKIKNGPGLRDLTAQSNDALETCKLLYLAILSRYPSKQELATAGYLCESLQGEHQLSWALINSDEFLFKH